MNAPQSKRLIPHSHALPRRSALMLGIAALGLGALSAPAAWAQAAWPTRPVTLLVGYPPGGQTDFAGPLRTVGPRSTCRR